MFLVKNATIEFFYYLLLTNIQPMCYYYKVMLSRRPTLQT